jgi:hypothetical protein
MSRRRISPLPMKGIDARASFGVSQDTLAYAEQVRGRTNAITHISNNQLFTTSASGTGAERARNLVQFFKSPPGGTSENVLMVFTNNGVYKLLSRGPDVWSVIESGLALPAIAVPGGTTYQRFAIANSAHKLVWTSASGSLRVRVFDGNAVTPIAQAYSSDHLIAFNHRILIAATIESGVFNGARIRWCANRNFNDWTGLSSGFLEVGSNLSSGSIRAMVNYDEQALVSLENELIEIVPTGSLFPVFEEGTHHIGMSIAGPHTWQVHNHVAFFLGPDSVYAWDRSKFIPIGRPIEPLLRQFLDPIRVQTMQGMVLQARGEYHLLINEGTLTGTTTGRVFIYDIESDRWFHDFGLDVSAIGKITTTYQPAGYLTPLPNISPEFTLAADAFDRVGFEEHTSTTPVGLAETQDFFAFDANQQPSVNAKNDFLALYFQTLPNAVVNVGYSINGGTSFVGGLVTANSEGYASFTRRVGFSKIRFRFVGVENYLHITGPLEMEYEGAGDTY